MPSESISKRIGKISCYVLSAMLLLIVGISVYTGAGFFPVDNPGVLFEGQLGWDRVVQAFTDNGRTDFMYSIIVVLATCLFPNTPVTHFMVQFAFFAVTGVFTFILLRISRVKHAITCLSLMVWLCGSAVAEQLYTIGKKEVFLAASITLCLLSLYGLIIANATGKKRWLLYGAYFTGLLFSLTIKETSIVLVCPLLLLQIYAIVWEKGYIKPSAVCLAVCVALILFQKAYQSIFISDNSYTAYEISVLMIIKNAAYYVRYNFDILVWGGIGFIANAIAFLCGGRQPKYVFFLTVNLTGWAYIGGLCFWRWPMSYYLYPPLVLFALSLGGVDGVKSLPSKAWQKMLKAAFVVMGTISVTYGVISNYCVGSSHVDVSRAYTDSIYTLLRTVKDGDRILLDNYDAHLEQVYQTRRLLTLYFHEDVSVYGANQSIWGDTVSDEALQLYGYTRETYEQEKALAVPRVGDYIVHYINNRNYYGQTRAVNPSFTEDVYGKLQAMGYTLELIDESICRRLLWDTAGGLLGIGEAEAGYQIWRVAVQE